MSESEKLCPKCGEANLKEYPTAKLKDNAKIKVIGHHHYCPNCNYEEDIKPEIKSTEFDMNV